MAGPALLREEDLAWLGRALLAETVQANRITTSIKNRVVNKIYYAGDETLNPGWRSIECWTYGRNHHGNDVIRAWQREGKSDTPRGNGRDPLRNKPGWRMFRVDGISSFQNATQRFETDAATASARKFNPHDRDMATIYYTVEATGGTEGEPGDAAAPTPPGQAPGPPAAPGQLDTRISG